MLTAERHFQSLFRRIPRKKSLVYKAGVSQGQKLSCDFGLSYKYRGEVSTVCLLDHSRFHICSPRDGEEMPQPLHHFEEN